MEYNPYEPPQTESTFDERTEPTTPLADHAAWVVVLLVGVLIGFASVGFALLGTLGVAH